SSEKVCKLQRSIYGLKKASWSWNLCFDEAVKEFGFVKNENEPCVYKKVSGSAIVFLVWYIDDILLIENDIPILQKVKTWLRSYFLMKNYDTLAILGPRLPIHEHLVQWLLNQIVCFGTRLGPSRFC